MEVGWAGSAPHFIYMHHTSLTAPAHLLFLLFFVFSLMIQCNTGIDGALRSS